MIPKQRKTSSKSAVKRTRTARRVRVPVPSAKRAATPKALVKVLSTLVEEARTIAAQQVNTVLVSLYWQVGQRMRDEVVGEVRAEYGEPIVSSVGRQLAQSYGAGFSEKGLRHMMRFVDAFPDPNIVSSLGRQL